MRNCKKTAALCRRRAEYGGTIPAHAQATELEALHPGFAVKGPEQNDIDNPAVHTLMRRQLSSATLSALELLPTGGPRGALLYRTGRHANKTYPFATSQPQELATASQSNGGRRCQARIDNYRRSLQTLQSVHRTIPMLVSVLCTAATPGRLMIELDRYAARSRNCALTWSNSCLATSSIERVCATEMSRF